MIHESSTHLVWYVSADGADSVTLREMPRSHYDDSDKKGFWSFVNLYSYIMDNCQAQVLPLLGPFSIKMFCLHQLSVTSCLISILLAM